MFRTACKRILAVACTLALAAGLTLIPVSAKTPALEAKEQAQATAGQPRRRPAGRCELQRRAQRIFDPARRRAGRNAD